MSSAQARRGGRRPGDSDDEENGVFKTVDGSADALRRREGRT
jgi:hypothetical protein